LVFAVGSLPIVWLVYSAIVGQLGPNPQEALVRGTGDWTLRFLCLVLAVTPLRVITGVTALARFRRMAGLYVYFYAVMHATAYGGFDQGFDLAEIGLDILKRPFILVGFLSLLLLTPLAVTSSNAVIRYMGSKRWKSLHRLVYVIAILALLHFFWMRAGKNDFFEVAIYACVVGVLLGWRVRQNFSKTSR
jgi:sulfoxide reductase heme-binding subunit YedZ